MPTITTSHEIAEHLLVPYLDHAVRMYESGYASAAGIDAAMKFGCGYKSGPFEVLAERGTDIAAAGPDALDTSKARTIGPIAVIGTGTMATGIAEVFARSGHPVMIVGRSGEKSAAAKQAVEKSLAKAVAKGKLEEAAAAEIGARIESSGMEEAAGSADLVVEAIAEDFEAKSYLFRILDEYGKDDAILATTTSSLSIAKLAEVTKRPELVVGLHFFNPAPIMKLVEVVSTPATSPEVVATAFALCQGAGKVAVPCGDQAGFIVNALLFPYLNDAVKLLEAGAGSVDEIDAAVTEHLGLPMGPFALLDVVGLDVSVAILNELHDAFGDPGDVPAPTLVDLVGKGHLGRKTGQGFHDYSA